MTHTITCPSCRRQLRVPDDLLGCMVKCPACSDNFPAEEPAPPRPAAGRGRDEYDEPRPSRRRPRDEEEDDRPPQRRRVRAEEDDDYPRIPQRDEKPGKVTAIGVMML